MNNIVKNALAAHRAVAKNAVSPEVLREVEADKQKLREIKKGIDAKGAKLAQKLATYYKAIDGLIAEQKRLENEVEGFKKEKKEAVRPFFKKYVHDDQEGYAIIQEIGFSQDWAKSCSPSGLTFRAPGRIWVAE